MDVLAQAALGLLPIQNLFVSCGQTALSLLQDLTCHAGAACSGEWRERSAQSRSIASNFSAKLISANGNSNFM